MSNAFGEWASLPIVAGLVFSVSLNIARAADPPYGMDSRATLQGVNFPDLPPSNGTVKVDRVFPQLTIGGIVDLIAPTGDDSQFYASTLGGIIYQFPNSPTVTSSSLKKVMDISGRTLTTGEQGLLGFALDPGFASNKTFYVYYAISTGAHRTRLSKFTVQTTSLLTSATTNEKVLLEIPQWTDYHKAGCLRFGPDGKLYLSTGDGSSGGDPGNLAQNKSEYYGKILRINPDGTPPNDNPFVGMAGANPYVWALGFRNPWRFGFDRSTGELWAGDVGQETIEEVDLVRKGGNYGWSVYEGNIPYRNPGNLPASNFDAPILAYPHDGTGLASGTSVTGGSVYRGTEMPGLAGQYIFGDFTGGTVYALSRSGGTLSVKSIGQVPQVTSFAEDNAGNLYALSIQGSIYRVQPAEQGSTNFPSKLSQTGLFTDLAHLTPARGLMEYEINAPFWSDGAIKRRWVGVPGTDKIAFSTQDAWTWPAMSVLVKHFEMAMADGTTKRLETRVLINQRPGWRGYTYRWNSAGTDADLIDGTQTVTLNVLDPSSPTGARTQTYEFPSRGACLTCHNSAHGEVLGLRTSQVNRAHKFPGGVTDNQLRTWNHIGLFNYDIGDAKYFYAMPGITDTGKGQPARARAYLDVNCSQCHSPGGPTAVNMDFRVYQWLSAANTIDVAPTAGDLGIADARRIAPGSKERSILWQRINSASGPRMPPIGSHVIDQNAVALIGAWIDAGAPDSPDQAALRAMYGGNYSGERNGLGNDVLTWNFPKAQSCSLTMYNVVNKSGKALGTFPGAYTFSRSGAAIKTSYSLGCGNPYGTDWWSITLQ